MNRTRFIFFARLLRPILMGIALIVLTGRCLDPYKAPSSEKDVRGLVVDGFFNGADGSCMVTITRTQTLESYEQPPIESGAKVVIDAGTGGQYTLNETTPGTYAIGGVPAPVGSTIRLLVTTYDKIQFESDPVVVLKTPEIDSVTWTNERAGVQIYANAHDEDASNKYFTWKYIETWYYTAKYPTQVTADAEANIIPLTENILECWTTIPSNEILISTSSAVQGNIGVVSKFPLTIVTWESPKLQLRYSILVEQRSISEQVFQYLEQLKKNTENLGTLFDPLPSAPQGNIHCITFPDQSVQGMFYASTVTNKRIYINSNDVDRPAGISPTTGYEGCFLVEIRQPREDFLHFKPVGSITGPWNVGTTEFCVDCRLNGGSNIQPAFWTW